VTLATALAALVAAGAPPPAEAPPEAARLLGRALAEGGAYQRLAELTDTVGARLTGSPGAEAAVRWALARFRKDGLEARLEPVRVHRWVRGAERAELLPAPGWRGQPLAVTALGGSPPTPPGGLAAEVVEAWSLEEVEKLGEALRGKVVLLQHRMGSGEGYGQAVRLRSRGPAAAARAGAAGALMRSLATTSLRSPHAGQTRFDPGERQIPAAALSTEDADLLHRLAGRGPVKVKLTLGCGPGDPPEAESANVVAEIRGRERPEEVVLLAAHLDSWDLGTGAVDDGAGVAMVMDAMRLAAGMGRPPRRTLRAVLTMNEENGLDGGVGYAERHRDELGGHVAAIEADSGAGRPTGLRVAAGPGGLEAMRALARPLSTLGADGVAEGDAGADVSPLHYQRVPALSVAQDTSRYFDWHHSAADTLDKVSPRDLAEATAALAWVAWALAEAPETLPRPEPPDKPPWWKPAPAPVAGQGAPRDSR
jgi:Zn-dependent M28 family amino/carboxypeptidase